MAAPVWVLSVDLQTKTATFASGMSEAAKSARGAFTDIKSGSTEMAGHVGTNMFASRHAVMAVSEAFGETMPRAITALLVHIGPLEQALQKAFPFAAIALGVVLLVEHFSKLKEEDQKLILDMQNFGTAVQNTFNGLDQKLLQAEIRSDELRNDHIGALHHQIELINKISLADLARSFGEVAKSADVFFGDLKSGLFSLGIGSAGAKHALDQFKAQYESLLAQGKDKEASDLLRGTRESAENILAMQRQAGANKATQTGPNNTAEAEIKFEAALAELKKAGVGYTEKELKAQETLVGALQAQTEIEGKIAQLKKLDSGNATQTFNNDASAKRAAAQTEAAEHTQKMGELTLAVQREQSQVSMATSNASIAERLSADLDFENKKFAIEQKGFADRIAALDKSGKDYNNQLKALQDKAAELVQQHAVTVATIQGKATMEQYRKDLADMEEGERAKIAATVTGSAARLAAIDAAIKAEEAKNLQNTQHYRELLTQRVEAERQSAAEEAKRAAEAGRIEADNELKMGQLSLTALVQHRALVASSRRLSDQVLAQQAIEATNMEYALQLTANAHEIAALDKHGKDYENKLRELQNRRTQLIQQHENQITQIQTQAEMQRNQRILAAEHAFNSTIASNLTQSLMGHQSFASAFNALGSQIVSGLMQNAAMSVLANDYTKESDAAAAARKMFLAGSHFPFPANIVMAPLLGAMAFASVMAFADGTDGVPGVGRGDIVPAMLTPGEGVVPGGVMDGLATVARNGGFSGQTGHTINAHFAPVINAIDANGVDGMLREHGDRFRKHIEGEIRKLGK